MRRNQAFCVILISALVFWLGACSSSESEKAVSDETSAAPTSGAPEQPKASAPETETEKAAEPEPNAGGPADEVKEAVKETDKTKEDEMSAALRNPTVDHEQAPAEFRVRFETTKGDFVVKLVREWSPRGVDHFYHMVKIGYYTDIAFFRAIEGFMVQFGMHGDPEINGLWADTNLKDDPVKVSNKRGYLTYAKTNLPNSRSTQLYINLADNANLDSYGFAPIGSVVEGMSVVDSIYMGYGEGAPRGRGPSQQLIGEQGNTYLKEKFPKLDYIKKTVILD